MRGPIRLDDAQELAAIMVRCGEMVPADQWVQRVVDERDRRAALSSLAGVA